MALKLDKREYPKNHTAADFKCFGPAAVADGDFNNCKIADLGCFTQDGKDSNKFYHAAVIQSLKDSSWWAYFQWGRTGASAPDFQFVQCSSESEAQSEFASQLHSKNDKRGQWTTIAGIKTLQAKPGKDCYLVRPQATRSTGLPDAKTIKQNDGAKPVPAPAAKGAKLPAGPAFDPPTLKLLQDLNFATVAYARGAMASDSLPTQSAIDEGRTILTEAQKLLITIGDDEDDQVSNKDLNDLTRLLYSRIPKVKPMGAPARTWVLSKANIGSWNLDLDAFESALTSDTSTSPTVTFDPFDGQPIHVSHLDPKSLAGAWIYTWMPKATRNRHGHVGHMKIHNAWQVDRSHDSKRFLACQDRIAAENKGGHKETAMFQTMWPGVGSRTQTYKDSNSAILFHGTRSVNVSGIMKKSLMLPKQLVGVVITGALYGPGLYFADDWKKSAGYTSLSGGYYSSGDGAVKGRHAFMFLTEVVLGNPHVAGGPQGFTAAPRGKHCVFGKAGGYVQNNEWIVYQTEQHILRYLVEFSTT